MKCSKGGTFALAAVLIAPLAACGSGDDDPDGSVEGPAGTVRMRLVEPWDSLDPRATDRASSYQVTLGLYDRLVAIGEDNEVIPYLATEWEVGPGRIDFTVRTDAVCADGTAVTAEVIADSLREGFLQTAYAQRQFGAGPFEVTVEDETHVSVAMGGESTDILVPFTEPPANIICPAGLAPDADYTSQAYGSGAYTLEEVDGDQTAVLQARDDWSWGPNGSSTADPRFPAELVLTVVANDTTAANLLTTGDLEIAYVNGPEIDRLSNDGNLDDLVALPPMGGVLQMNQAPGKLLSDEVLREAVATAISAEEYSAAAENGRGEVTTSFMSSEMPCFDPSVGSLIPETSIDRARDLIESRGWTRGSDGIYEKDGQKLTLNVIGSETRHQAGPDYIAARLVEVGFEASLFKADHNTFSSAWRASDFDVTPFNINNPLPSPLITISYLLGPQAPEGNNFANVADPVAEQAVEDARTATTEEDRCEAWSTVQRSLLESFQLRPLTAPEQHYFVRGVTFEPRAAYIDVLTIRQR